MHTKHDKTQQNCLKLKALGGASNLRGSPADYRINPFPWHLRPLWLGYYIPSYCRPHRQAPAPGAHLLSVKTPAPSRRRALAPASLPPASLFPQLSLERPSGCLEDFLRLAFSSLHMYLQGFFSFEVIYPACASLSQVFDLRFGIFHCFWKILDHCHFN